MYPVTGLPPSLVGGSHCSVMESSVVAAASGAPGLPGGSRERNNDLFFSLPLVVCYVFKT